jgi:DNA mismatch endonuclease (patch repair protein)
MSKVRSKNTSPELAVRKLVFSLGYRYHLHAKNLPGKPDLVFPGRKKVIFVHGCFWHYHDCKIGHIPKSRLDYWEPKLMTRRKKDTSNAATLMESGWGVLVIWECEIKDQEKLRQIICEFLARRLGWSFAETQLWWL